MSLLDDILNEGLDELLCTVGQLPNYSDEKRKEQEYTIINYDLHSIMFKLDEYLKNLPVPGVRLSVSNVIVIHNLRRILEGVSIIFDVHISTLTKLFSNWMKHKYQKHQGDSAEVMKPKQKYAKTRKLVKISEAAEISGVELKEPNTYYGLEKESFFEVSGADIDGAALFDRHYDELRLLTTTHETGDLLRDSMHLPLEITASRTPHDLERSQLQLSVPAIDERPFRPIHQLLTIPAEAEVIPSPIVRPPPVNQFIADLEKIIKDISQVSQPKISGLKKSKYLFRVQPIMTTEQYEHFLRQRKQKTDPIQFYTTQKDGSVDPRFVELSEKENIEHELLDDGLDSNLLQITKQKIFFYPISLQLRNQVQIGEIPEFELPQEQQESMIDGALRSEAPEGEMVLEQRPHLISLRDVPTAESIVQESYHSQQENIISHLSLLMNDLTLYDFSTSVHLVSERQSQVNVERLRTITSPLREVNEGILDVQHSPVHHLQSRVGTIDDVFILVAERFSEMKTDVIAFSDICSLSETKLVAAKLFGHIIVNLQLVKVVFSHENKKKEIMFINKRLWNVFTVNQTSSHPNDIFITMKKACLRESIYAELPTTTQKLFSALPERQNPQ